MLSKRSRTILFLIVAAVVAGFALQPLLVSYRERLGYGLRAATGQWGDGSARFVDVAAQDGLDYRWTIPGPRPLDILQTIGDGCAFLDYDHSGDLSILLVGTDHLALFKGDGRGHFTDVSHATGLDRFRGHFLGVAVGDYDNDGYDDLYISGYRTGLLLRNEGGKSFKDVTAQAGLRPQPWGTSCAWGDIDGSGRLSLYVGNYVQYDPPRDPRLCPVPGGLAACPPTAYRPAFGVLYHNEGGGRFRDVTRAWGADQVSGKALGVAFVTEGAPGHPSLAIANDELPGDLLRFQAGRLVDQAAQAGVADTDGQAHAGMGLDWGDYDNDGHPDLFVGTFALEPKPLYHSVGPGVYQDASAGLGLRDRPTEYLTFGAKWLDYDNDGWLDLVLADGHVRDNVGDYRAGATFLQPTLLLHNDGGRRFTDMSGSAGPDLGRSILGRGLATGDFENDGRVDVLVADSQGAPLLLRNESKAVGHWLSLTLVGTKSNRDGYGALVTVTAGGLTQTRECHADGSYLSSSDKRVHIGLGTLTRADTVTVRWPSGHTDTFAGVPADRFYTLREGDRRLDP